MTIVNEKMSALLLGIPPSKTSGADNRTLPAHRVVPLGGSEDVVNCSSGIIVCRLKPARQARPLLSIRIFDLRARSALIRRQLRGTSTHPVNISVDYSVVMQIGQPIGNVCELRAHLIIRVK